MSVSIRSFSEKLHSAHLPIKEIALKEWAVCIEALTKGEQLLLVRKGGLLEETRDFRLEETSFYLYPTYEHQRANLIKPEYAERVKETLAGIELPPREVKITSVAHVVDDITTHEEEVLQKLDRFHILTHDYAKERLLWKSSNPLHLLVVRAYRLSEPKALPVEEAYTGCKSWIRLEQPLAHFDLEPVLSDEEFRAKREAIHQALGISH